MKEWLQGQVKKEHRLKELEAKAKALEGQEVCVPGLRSRHQGCGWLRAPQPEPPRLAAPQLAHSHISLVPTLAMCDRIAQQQMPLAPY
jgi:hypothetical protein